MIDFITASFYDLLEFVRGVEPLYIYIILFAIAFVENLFPPIPGDTFTIVGGYMAASGLLDVKIVFICITVGTILSVMLVYYLGRSGGRDFFMRRNMRIFSIKDIDNVQSWFDRFGSATLIFSRFIVGARVAVAFGAGLSRFPALKMTILSYLSAALFHGILIILAYLMHTYIEKLTEWFNLYNKIILVIVALLVIIWLVILFRRLTNDRKRA